MTKHPGDDSTAKMRVLVVEDDRPSRVALTALLRMIGYEPLPAGTVAEGLRLLDERPWCVIVDLMLPDGNGSQLLAHVRENNMPIRVVVTTGAIDAREMLKAASEPPDAIFAKPVDFLRLADWFKSEEKVALE